MICMMIDDGGMLGLCVADITFQYSLNVIVLLCKSLQVVSKVLVVVLVAPVGLPINITGRRYYIQKGSRCT